MQRERADQVAAINRRAFLRAAAATGAGLSILPILNACLPASSLAGATASHARSNELIIATDVYWGTLDFRKLVNFHEWQVASLLYSALVRNSDTFQAVPDLAERWEIRDATTYVFHLRKAKFHDGTDVTSADVKSTFDAVIDPKFGAPNRPLFGAIESVEADDPVTVTMRLRTPNPSLLSFLAWIGIVPKHHAEQRPNDVGTQPIGSGPYQFVSTVSQNNTVIKAFDGYWGGKPAFNQITYRVIPEATTRTVETQSGNVDIGTRVSFADIETLKADSKLYVVRVPPDGFHYVALNFQNPALADLRVRRAINHAIDRASINKTVYRDLAQLATGPVIPDSWGYNKDVLSYEYDVAKARQLLTDAGIASGLKLTLTTHPDQQVQEIATILKQQLAAVGIDLTVNTLEYTVMIANGLVKGEFGDMLLFSWGVQLDPQQHMQRQFLSTNQPPNGFNFVHYVNPRLDELLTQANATIEPAKRKPLLDEAQVILANDVPYVFLFNVPQYWAVNRAVEGITAPPPMDRQFLDLALKAKWKT